MSENFVPKLIDDGSPYTEWAIGGTGMSAVTGANPYIMPMDFWLRATGQADPVPDNLAMQLGRHYEPVVANIFQGANDNYDVRYNFSGTDAPCRVMDQEYDFIQGSPDRILFQGGVPVAGLEIKTASCFTKNNWGESGSGDVPMHYLVQCLHYMGLTGLHDWRLAVLFLDDGQPNEYRSYQLHFDEEVWQYMREEAVKFWKQYVEPVVAPPMGETVGETTIQYFRKKYPADVKPMEMANDAETILITQLIDAQTELKNLEQQVEVYKASLMNAIGDRQGLTSSVGKVTWKKSKDREVTDWKAVAEALDAPEELIKEHTTTRDGARVFRVAASH